MEPGDLHPPFMDPASPDLHFSDQSEPDGLDGSLANRLGIARRGRRTEGGDPLSRLHLAILFICFLGICLLQAPGLIEFDTSLPLVVSPVSFFGSVLHLWNPLIFGGAVAQGAGFLVPQGLFFLAASVLHVPAWVAERIWLAVLLTAGVWGVARLAEALRIGGRGARVIAGIAYCIAPIVVTWVTTSGDLLAVVLLPWVLRPLVLGSREGSTRQAAARSGLAIALMGGSNAALVIAVLALPAIWLLTREPGPRRRSLATWWAICGAMACFFWMVMLLFVGHFGYNYLPATETSIATTRTASVFEALRGASAWTDYYVLHVPLLKGAWILVSEPVIIVGTAVVVALGLAGLCRHIPEKLFLIASLAFGVVVISAGYSGPLGGAFSHSVQHLLQNSLAPFRNISKFSPDVTLPIVLGLAWILSAPRERIGRHIWQSAKDRSIRPALVVIVIAAVIASAAPFWQRQLYGSGGFAAIPSYWQQTGTYLNEHQGHGNALLVPGANIAWYTWGRPQQEPLQTVASTPLEWRNIIPLGSNGNTQMLDAVEQALDDGISPPGFAAFLSREGVKYVVERNDLNLQATGAPPPAEVHQVLSETSGLTEVASFGPYLPASQVASGRLPVYDSPHFLRLRAVNVYRVGGAASAVQTFTASDPVVVSGDVGSALPISGSILHARVSVLSGDPDARTVPKASGTTWAITDGNQRRVTSFGSIRNNESYLLGPDQTLPNMVAGVPQSFAVVNGAQHQTVSAPMGAESVSASSFGSTPLIDSPTQGPAVRLRQQPGFGVGRKCLRQFHRSMGVDHLPPTSPSLLNHRQATRRGPNHYRAENHNRQGHCRSSTPTGTGVIPPLCFPRHEQAPEDHDRQGELCQRRESRRIGSGCRDLRGRYSWRDVPTPHVDAG